MLNRLPKLVELSHEWYLTNFKYQELDFYPRLFDELKKEPFGVSLGHTKIYKYINQYLVLLSCMFEWKKSVCVLCSL